MGCSSANEEIKNNNGQEMGEKKLNKTQDKKMVINANKNVTVCKNYKKETQKGLTILENVKEILPKDISKENIKDMVYNALGNTIVDKSKFIKGVNLTDEHAQNIVDILYNIVHNNENLEQIDNLSLKDINVTIGFYDATEENVRRFMFKKKNPTNEEVKNTLIFKNFNFVL